MQFPPHRLEKGFTQQHDDMYSYFLWQECLFYIAEYGNFEKTKKKKRVDLAFNLGLVQLMTSGRALSKRSSADFPIFPHHAEMGWK